MPLSMERWLIGGLLAVVASLAAIAAFAPNAGATQVSEPNHNVSVTLQENTISWFVPSNAYAPVGVGCTGVTASFTVPGPMNMNNTNRGVPSQVGDYSLTPGGVWAPLSAPQFSDCDAYVMTAPRAGVPFAEVGVTSSGDWSISADAIDPVSANHPDGIVAIAVPHNAVAIDLDNAIPGCTVQVTASDALAVMSDFTNGSNSTDDPSELEVDSQVDFSPTGSPCNLESPSQFEAVLEVRDTTSSADPVTVLP